MINVNKTGKTYVIALTPENRKEQQIIDDILALERNYKRTKEEEHDYWTIKPQKKVAGDVEYTPEQFKELIKTTHSPEGIQMTFDDFVPLTKELMDELPFK